MEAIILDSSFKAIGLVDVYNSFIWKDKYIGCGDYELYLPFTATNYNLLSLGNYISIKESPHLMCIETMKFTTDEEDGVYLTSSGRSLTSLLDRRVIWTLTSLSGGFQEGIRKLFVENVISPGIPARAIPNFEFIDSIDPLILNEAVSAQFTGDNLYTAVEKLCKDRDIGFRLMRSDNGFRFELYAGVDRSANVKFSPFFDNILDSRYLASDKPWKNVALIGGEGEGVDRKFASVGVASGLQRRELFVDARNISSNSGPNTLTEIQYLSLLRQEGHSKLAGATATSSFDATTIPNIMYMYGIDYGLGDIVRLENEFGISSSARVSEVLIVQDLSRKNIIPKFDII